MEWAFVIYVLSGDVDHRTIKLVSTFDQCSAMVKEETQRINDNSLPPAHMDCIYVSEVYDETLLDDIQTDNISVTVID